MKIRVLGPLEVAIDGAEVDLGGSRPRTLLGILIANRGHPVSMDRLIDEIWGESPPPSSVGTVQAYVSRLRGLLGEKVIIKRRSGYALDLPSGTIDADVFAEPTLAEGFDEPERLQTQLSLWRGRPFDDVADTPSISQERTRLEELRLTLLERRIDLDLAGGRYHELAAELEGLVAANPYRERLAGQLMLALYQAGRQTEALGVFASLRNRLVNELGLSPSPELASLEESILRQSPGLAAPASPRHNLPAARSTFIGRRSELEGVASKLQEARLVTLTGAGGSGKTRLALEISRSLLGRFKDGVWWVELDQISDPGLLDDTIAVALGLIGTGEGLLPERRQGAVTSQVLVDALAGKEVLVVLDNCEHLVDPTAALVDRMLDRCPGLTILATSREPLAVPGEVVWLVPPLEVIESGAGEGGDAVELFMARARAALPTFQVDQDAARFVAEICRRLDGMPLAIELAAARVRAFSLEEIAAKLEHRFRFLSGGSRSAHSRLQSLGSTVEWSYNLLSYNEQALFRRLAPFRSWFSLEAVENVTAFEPIAPEDASGLLAALVDKSMIQTRFEGAGSHRYRLLETLREYASAQQTGPEQATLMVGFTDYYVEIAESGLSHLHDPQQLFWLRRFEDEQPNFRAALDHLLVVGSHDEAMRLTGALGEFWVLRGLVGEARSWIDRVLGAAPNSDIRWKARVLGTASSMAEMAGEPETAHTFAIEALAAFEQVGDKVGRADALRLRAITGASGRRDPSDLDEATAASRDAGDPVGLAWSLLERAMTVFWNAGYSEMLGLAEEARQLFEEIGDKLGIANALLVEARATHLLGRSGASDLLQEALGLFRQASARPAIAWTLYDLAEVLAASDDPAAGDHTYREAVAEFDAVGIRFGRAVGYGSWGWWARRAGQHELSAERFDRSLSESLEIRQTGNAIWMFESIAGLAGEIGLLDQAAVLFGAADRWRGELQHPMPAWDLARYQPDLASLKAESQEESFDAHWDRGAALSWEQTVAAARAITDKAREVPNGRA
jgi:predicted ATPase/DNA-binding SARP family transcriptional activator